MERGVKKWRFHAKMRPHGIWQRQRTLIGTYSALSMYMYHLPMWSGIRPNSDIKVTRHHIQHIVVLHRLSATDQLLGSVMR